MLCEFGCGQEAKFQTKSSGRWHCLKSTNSCPKIREKNSNGLLNAIESGRKTYTYYSSLSDKTKTAMNWNKGKLFADFSINGKGNHKGILLKERGHKCEKCFNESWLGQPITIELEHKDGNGHNNEKSNLELLCPNCHSQTKTYKGLNIKRNKIVSDEVFIQALRNTPTIRAALIELELTPKGKNYYRAYELLAKIKLAE